MSEAFAPVARSLGEALADFYAQDGGAVSEADRLTIDTNSAFVARRAAPIEELLLGGLGRPDLTGVRILDAGTGFGALAVYFAARGASVTGLDPHHERFVVGASVGRQHRLDVTFDDGYLEQARYPDASFDAVVMNNSLCYIVDDSERRDALAQALRVLRPGGVLVARNPNRAYPIDQFTRLPLIHFLPPAAAERLGGRLRGHRSKVRLLTAGGARRELQAAGFTDVESHGFVSRGWTRPLRALARYHHQVARKPG